MKMILIFLMLLFVTSTAYAETFRHHPDGIIYIDGQAIKLTEFMIEEPDYALPPGFIGREYVQDSHHRVNTGSGDEVLDTVWLEGDVYIVNLSVYLENIAARKQIPEEEGQRSAIWLSNR